MREFIKKQLESVSFADLSNYNATTNTYYIKKYSKPVYDVGKCYLIKISKQLINNTQSITAVNWNNCNAPKHEYYKAYVSTTAGKMIYCDCLAVDYENKKDLTDIYSGWFNVDDLTQIEVSR